MSSYLALCGSDFGSEKTHTVKRQHHLGSRRSEIGFRGFQLSVQRSGLLSPQSNTEAEIFKSVNYGPWVTGCRIREKMKDKRL